jgi:hypothetical protein
MYMIVRKSKTCCSSGPLVWLRKLSLADGSEVSVIGLDMIFSALAREHKAPDSAAAAEIVRRLVLKNNIPSSLVPLCGDAALREYEAFLTCRLDQEKTACAPTRPGRFLSRLMQWIGRG